MARTALLSALLTKRGVIIALVVGIGLLGAGFGFLPALLDGADDAGDTGVSPGETTRQSDETVETASGRDDAETVTAGGETLPTVTTGESDGAGGSDTTGESDGGAAGRTRTTDSPETTDATAGEGSDDDGPTRDPDPDDETTTDGPPEVGVQAESNATVSSLADYSGLIPRAEAGPATRTGVRPATRARVGG